MNNLSWYADGIDWSQGIEACAGLIVVGIVFAAIWWAGR
jgi:hypothetical protein